MSYGYKEWRKEEGADKSARLGALEKILAIIENLRYPRHKWGMIRPNELEERVTRMMGQAGDNGAAQWDQTLAEVLAFLGSKPWPVYCFDKIEAKELVNHVKQLVKEAGGAVDAKDDKGDDDEAEE